MPRDVVVAATVTIASGAVVPATVPSDADVPATIVRPYASLLTDSC